MIFHFVLDPREGRNGKRDEDREEIRAHSMCIWLQTISWGVDGSTNIPLKEIFHNSERASDFDPQKYVTNFSRANRFTINPFLMPASLSSH